MIGRVYRGRDTAGLLDYLYRPGRRNEHVDPHLVASWDGAPDTLEPPASPGRPGRYEVGRLARPLDAPAAGAAAVLTLTIRQFPGRSLPKGAGDGGARSFG